MRRICETSIAPSAYLQHTRKPQVYYMLYIHRFFVCFFTFRVGVFQKLLPILLSLSLTGSKVRGREKEKEESPPVVLKARACAAAVSAAVSPKVIGAVVSTKRPLHRQRARQAPTDAACGCSQGRLTSPCACSISKPAPQPRDRSYYCGSERR